MSMRARPEAPMIGKLWCRLGFPLTGANCSAHLGFPVDRSLSVQCSHPKISSTNCCHLSESVADPWLIVSSAMRTSIAGQVRVFWPALHGVSPLAEEEPRFAVAAAPLGNLTPRENE